MDTVKLYVATHKPCYIPKHPLLVPLQIGTALHTPIANMLHDHVGENISAKNPNYCELTGQYWAWKNENADYYGFFHYRRYFSFRHEEHPYVIYDLPNDPTLQHIGYEPDYMESFIRQYDIIVPQAENLYESAWDNYRRAPYHFIEDLELVVRMLLEQYPGYQNAVDTYMNGTTFYLKNMYIMSKALFHQYCSWLFSLLAEFDQRNDWTKYHNNPTALRVDGYLAERLFGIWYTNLKQTQPVKSCELSRVHFANLDGGRGSLRNMKWINQVLPPGTRRRSIPSRCARFALKQYANTKLK